MNTLKRIATWLIQPDPTLAPPARPSLADLQAEVARREAALEVARQALRAEREREQ